MPSAASRTPSCWRKGLAACATCGRAPTDSSTSSSRIATPSRRRCCASSRWNVLLPGNFHTEEVHEHFAVGTVLRVLLRAANVEVDLLRGGIYLSRRAFLSAHRIVHAQRLAIANALRDHEVHLVVLVERLAVQGRVAVTPAREIHERLRPIVVAAA